MVKEHTISEHIREHMVKEHTISEHIRKQCCNRLHRGTALAVQLMHHGVSIQHRHLQVGEHRCHRALAHANGARQAQFEGPPWRRLWAAAFLQVRCVVAHAIRCSD